MKLILFLLLCFCILMSNANALAFGDKSRERVLNLESSNLEYDLGHIEKGKIIERTIRIRNRLDEPLVITEARSTCDCLEIYVDPQVVKKGEIFEVKLTIDSTEIKGDDIEEVVYILTNNMNYELIRLTIWLK